MPQLKYFQSEVFELNEAIIQYENCNFIEYENVEGTYLNNIAEEIADVEVMLLQFKEYYNIDGKQILEIMNKKIDRQIGRIKKESDINES